MDAPSLKDWKKEENRLRKKVLKEKKKKLINPEMFPANVAFSVKNGTYFLIGHNKRKKVKDN